MDFNNKFKKIICFSLLYTIFVLNSSVFYIFANNLDENKENTTQGSQNEETTNNNEDNDEETDPLNLFAGSAVLIDADTGIVLYDKNMNERAYPASTTKILTALLALENTQLNDTLTHSHNAIFNIIPGSSHIGMRENETISIEQALYGILLASANEVSMAMAEKISGSVEDFIVLMNERLEKIGAVNSNFSNVYGAPEETHYTTAYDMALILKDAVKNEKFVEIINTWSYKIPPTNIVDEERIMHNSNKMIMETSPFFYEYSVGGKTGYTSESGNTLASYAKKGDINLIAVVMKDDGTKVYDDTKALFEYGFSLYDSKNIFDKETYDGKANVSQKYNGKDYSLDEIYVSPEKSLTLDLPSIVDVSKIEQKVNLPNPVAAPVNIGDAVGNIEFYYDGNKIASVDLLSNDTIELVPEAELAKKEKITSIISTTLTVLKYGTIIIVALIIILLIVAFFTRRISKNRRKNRKRNRYYNSNKKPLTPLNNKTRRGKSYPNNRRY